MSKKVKKIFALLRPDNQTFAIYFPTKCEFFSPKVLFISKPAVLLFPLAASVAAGKRAGHRFARVGHTAQVLRDSASAHPTKAKRAPQRDIALRTWLVFFDILARNAAEKCGGYEPRTAQEACR